MNVDAMIAGFHFLRPAWLLLLPLLVPLLWYLRRVRMQSRSWQAVCDAALLPHLLTGQGGKRQRRSTLFIAGFVGVFSIIALAGPTWQQLEQPVFRDQSALVVILDLSRSMDATDVRPTRLTRARHKLIDILRQRHEGQAALIVYAAEPFVVSPLSEDAETIIAQVSSLETALMPQQGSRPDLAIDLALQLLQQAGALNGELLLISDGVENVPQQKLQLSLEELTASGYRLSVLGVGDAEGAPIALTDGGFLKDSSGAIVIPRLDEAALRALAQQGKGRYQAMRIDDRDIATLLSASQLNADALAEASQGFKADRWREEGPWLLLLLLPLVLVAFRRGHLLLVSLVALPLLTLSPIELQAAERSWWSDLWSSADQRGARAFERDRLAEAAQQFENSEWQAAAHYRAGDYQQSIDALQGLEHADALYNKGNAYAQLGQWQAALDAYEQVLRRQPDHADAKYNRDLVREQMEQQSSDQSDDQSGQGQSSQQGDQSQQGSSQQSGEQGESQQNDSAQSASQQDEVNQGGGESAEQQQAQSSKDGEDAQEQQMMDQVGASDDGSGEESLEGLREMARDEAQQQSRDEAEAQQQASAIAPSELSEEQIEIQQANDQWLRRIPDDPGGLLRRKFQYQSQRAQRRSGGQQQVEEKGW